MTQATSLTYAHEFILPYSGPLLLPEPWRLLASNADQSVHLLQNVTSAPVTIPTGVPSWPTVDVPAGDTLVAVIYTSNPAVLLIGRIPYAGRRFTTAKTARLDLPDLSNTMYDEGDTFIALAGLRGSCGGVASGSVTATWNPEPAVPGFPGAASANGVATQPTGDAAGNISAGQVAILNTGGVFALSGFAASSGPCGLSLQNRRPTAHLILASEPLEFGSRIRSSVSEDAGSLFQATQAVAVELGISEAFEYGGGPGTGLRFFREALTPNETAIAYYPVPTRNQEMLATVEGETNLGRLAHTIAPRIFTRGLDVPGNVDGIVTAQQAIQHVVEQFAAEHPWLVFEPIPDLRLLVPEAVSAPRQYYLDNPDAGVLTTSNVVIEQEGNERRTMREVLDEWLQIFPGTIVRQTSRGTIELVPRVGPDAPDGPSVELAWRDLARMSDGENDPRGVYNHARAISQGWDWVENQGLIPPSFTVVRGENGLERSVLDSEEVLPIDTREEFEPGAAVEFEVMASQDAVEVDVGLTAFGSWSQNAAMSFSVEGTDSHNFTLLPGQRRDVTLQHTSRSNNVVFRTRVTRAPEGDRITLSWPSGVPADARNVFGITFLAYEVTLDVGGTAWTRSNQSIEAEWGTEEHEIPAVGGGDALAQSRAQYGVRSATIQSNIFQLTPEQAMAVARGYVLHNINPRTIRDVQQSEWRRYPVKFDHIGRYVELPNGEVAVVENRSYSDSFAPRASAMMSTFTATVSHSVIDTSTEFMYLDSGDYAQLDDGTLVEAS